MFRSILMFSCLIVYYVYSILQDNGGPQDSVTDVKYAHVTCDKMSGTSDG